MAYLAGGTRAMVDIPIMLVGPGGHVVGQLGLGARALADDAEQQARARNLSKRTALPLILREHVESAGYVVVEASLTAAASDIDSVRRGETRPVIEVAVHPIVDVADGLSAGDGHSAGKETPVMPRTQQPSPPSSFFEVERVYPNDTAHAWFERLVGLDEHKRKLLVELEMLLYPEGLLSWSDRHHGAHLHLCEIYRDRVPLVLLEGDVGTGKTALAETIGDALARRIGGKATVLLLNTTTLLVS